MLQESVYSEQPNRYNRYSVGIMVDPVPEDQQIKNMFYLVAYDICDPSRLRRVAKTCEAYGLRIEKSVFQCDIKAELFQDLWCTLIDLIDEEEDAVIAYRICSGCLKKAESMGIVDVPTKPLCYIM